VADTVPIGELRWPVRIYRRDQVASATTTGIAETLKPMAHRMAKIEATRPMTFYGSAQVDTPVTHMILMRWVGGLDTTHAILRTTTTPGEKARHEVFRVRRVLEMGGRKRFVMVEAELERGGI